MKIGTILTATNTKQLYIEFIPIFVKAWKKIIPEADICIVLIGTEIPNEYINTEYSQYIHLFPPVSASIDTAFQAQCIRLLYPRQIPASSGGILITDIDMIPLQRKYYVESIKKFPDNSFVVYRDVCLPEMISMCYNVANSATWTEIFGEESAETILKRWYESSGYDGKYGGKGWCTDQYKLIDAINKWGMDSCGNRMYILNDLITGFRRLDRGDSEETFNDFLKLAQDIHQGKYSDYHCLRPHSEYRKINDFILKYIPVFAGKPA